MTPNRCVAPVLRARQGMRLVLGFVVTSVVAFVVSILACSPQSSPAQGPDSAQSGETSSAHVAATPSSSPSDAVAAGSGPNVELTREPPDGGVTMNNAQTSKDAGSSDRLQPILDEINQNRDKFRACFDAWSKKNVSGSAGSNEYKVLFSLKLKPSGELEGSKIIPEKSDIQDPTLESCMADTARTIKFPPSPSGKVTTYNHPFFFKAKL